MEVVPTGSRRCLLGGETKPVSEFYERSGKPGQYLPSCIEHHKAQARADEMRRRGTVPQVKETPPPPGFKRCNGPLHKGALIPLSEFLIQVQATGKRRSICGNCHKLTAHAVQ